MRKHATLSVLVPVYNVEKYLRRALDSILTQTYKVHEIICVDDGSTDDCPHILQEYAERYPKIKVIRKENGGLVSARKAAMQAATGEYIAHVDSDDYIEPDMYRDLMALMTENDADIVTSGLIRDYGNHVVVERETIPAGLYTGDEVREKICASLIDIESFYSANLSAHITNKIFKRELVYPLQMKLDDRICVGEDAAVIYPCLFQADRVYVSGKNDYHYCVRNDSIMGVKTTDSAVSLSVMLDYLEKEFYRANETGTNLDKQFEVFRNYMLLLRNTQQAIFYKNGLLYPFGNITRDKKILLYGAGKFGSVLKEKLEAEGFRLAAWADKAGKREGVIHPSQIGAIEYDIVIIAVLVSKAVKEIRRELEEQGVGSHRIYEANVEFMIQDASRLEKKYV